MADDSKAGASKPGASKAGASKAGASKAGATPPPPVAERKFWLMLLATAGFMVVLFGIDGNIDVEVYGLKLSIKALLLAIYALGAVVGWASYGRRPR